MEDLAARIQYLYPEWSAGEFWQYVKVECGSDCQDCRIVEWNYHGPQPTQAELNAITEEDLRVFFAIRCARSDRAAAYAAEADPLFFKAQRGEATTQEWESKVSEIRSRFPYPDEVTS